VIACSWVRYGGFCGIDGLGGSFGIRAPSDAGSNVVLSMILDVKGIDSDDAPAFGLSTIDWMADGVGGVYGFCNFALPRTWVGGRAIGLGNGAGVAYSDDADSQRSASAMVIGLPASYVEFRVAMGFAAYVLYGVFLASLLKKVLKLLGKCV